MITHRAPHSDSPTTRSIDRGDDAYYERGIKGRASVPPSPVDHTDEPASRTYRLLYNPYAGRYRVYACRIPDPPPAEADYVEIEHYVSKEALARALRNWPDLFHVVVFEDQATGEIYLDRLSDLPDDWLDRPRLPCFTLFNSETDATVHARQRRWAFKKR